MLRTRPIVRRDNQFVNILYNIYCTLNVQFADLGWLNDILTWPDGARSWLGIRLLGPAQQLWFKRVGLRYFRNYSTT